MRSHRPLGKWCFRLHRPESSGIAGRTLCVRKLSSLLQLLTRCGQLGFSLCWQRYQYGCLVTLFVELMFSMTVCFVCTVPIYPTDHTSLKRGVQL